LAGLSDIPMESVYVYLRDFIFVADRHREHLDYMNSPARIAEEWALLSVSDFMKLYNAELAKYAGSRMDKLRTDSVDKIQYTQGEVNALGWVTNLPNRIMTELAEKSKQGV